MSSTIMYKELEQSCFYSHVAMCRTTMELWLDSKQEQDMSLFSEVFRPLLGNTQPAIQQVLQAVSRGRSMNLTTHLHLESKFKKCGDISPLPLTSHWHDT